MLNIQEKLSAELEHKSCYKVRLTGRRGGWGGGWRRSRYRDCDDDRGPSIGTLLLGAGAAYGAYRIYDDYRSRHDHHKRDDDD